MLIVPTRDPDYLNYWLIDGSRPVTLPTSDPGVLGLQWNDGGTVKISAGPPGGGMPMGIFPLVITYPS